jgi:hypothetical protein
MSTVNARVDESLVTLLALAHRVVVEGIELDEVRRILKSGMNALPADRLIDMPEYRAAMKLVSQ